MESQVVEFNSNTLDDTVSLGLLYEVCFKWCLSFVNRFLVAFYLLTFVCVVYNRMRVKVVTDHYLSCMSQGDVMHRVAVDWLSDTFTGMAWRCGVVRCQDSSRVMAYGWIKTTTTSPETIKHRHCQRSNVNFINITLTRTVVFIHCQSSYSGVPTLRCKTD